MVQNGGSGFYTRLNVKNLESEIRNVQFNQFLNIGNAKLTTRSESTKIPSRTYMSMVKTILIPVSNGSYGRCQ